MEINQPDRGVFRGMGRLQANKHVNKKFFPGIRNMQQFQLTHNHSNQYKTSLSAFRPFEKSNYKYVKVSKNSNESHIDFGRDACATESEMKTHFRKYNHSVPAKPIKQPEQGLGINQYSVRTGDKVGYSTTAQQNFGSVKQVPQKLNVKYKYSRTDRFNPITGQSKISPITFGYEDFVPQASKNYKANNFTVIPTRQQRFDIISGRKLTDY